MAVPSIRFSRCDGQSSFENGLDLLNGFVLQHLLDINLEVPGATLPRAYDRPMT